MEFNENDLKQKYKNLDKGSPCILDFGENGIVKNCIVDEKLYSEGCVYYHVRVYPHKENPLDYTVLQFVRSLYVQGDKEDYTSKYI